VDIDPNNPNTNQNKQGQPKINNKTPQNKKVYKSNNPEWKRMEDFKNSKKSDVQEKDQPESQGNQLDNQEGQNNQPESLENQMNEIFNYLDAINVALSVPENIKLWYLAQSDIITGPLSTAELKSKLEEPIVENINIRFIDIFSFSKLPQFSFFSIKEITKNDFLDNVIDSPLLKFCFYNKQEKINQEKPKVIEKNESDQESKADPHSESKEKSNKANIDDKESEPSNKNNKYQYNDDSDKDREEEREKENFKKQQQEQRKKELQFNSVKDDNDEDWIEVKGKKKQSSKKSKNDMPIGIKPKVKDVDDSNLKVSKKKPMSSNTAPTITPPQNKPIPDDGDFMESIKNKKKK